MLGSALIKGLGNTYNVIGTSRRNVSNASFFRGFKVYSGIASTDLESINTIILKHEIDIVINCVGVVKQVESSASVLDCLPVNSLFPHQLNNICKQNQIKLIQFSTDCVFTGASGYYKESDTPDCRDIYGMSKYLGELQDEDSLTIRTSLIGHELFNSHSLVDWFLNQNGVVNGFSKAFFSGFPTIFIADILKLYVLGKNLSGVYHVAASPISKYELLSMISKQYSHDIKIYKETHTEVNRVLDGRKFEAETGFVSPSWDDLIKTMYETYRWYK